MVFVEYLINLKNSILEFAKKELRRLLGIESKEYEELLEGYERCLDNCECLIEEIVGIVDSSEETTFERIYQLKQLLNEKWKEDEYEDPYNFFQNEEEPISEETGSTQNSTNEQIM